MKSQITTKQGPVDLVGSARAIRLMVEAAAPFIEPEYRFNGGSGAELCVACLRILRVDLSPNEATVRLCPGGCEREEEDKDKRQAHGWDFERRSGGYYAATTRLFALSRNAAEELHLVPFTGERGRHSGDNGILGDAVRFNGWAKGKVPDGPCDCYHIDSDDALAAFVKFIGGLRRGRGRSPVGPMRCRW